MNALRFKASLQGIWRTKEGQVLNVFELASSPGIYVGFEGKGYFFDEKGDNLERNENNLIERKRGQEDFSATT